MSDCEYFKRMKNAVEKLGESVNSFCEKYGISCQCFYSMKDRPPSGYITFIICKKSGVNANYLFGIEDEQTAVRKQNSAGIHDRLKRLMEIRGISAKEASDIIGCSANAVIYWSDCDRYMSHKSVISVCSSLVCDPEWLLGMRDGERENRTLYHKYTI